MRGPVTDHQASGVPVGDEPPFLTEATAGPMVPDAELPIVERVLAVADRWRVALAVLALPLVIAVVATPFLLAGDDEVDLGPSGDVRSGLAPVLDGVGDSTVASRERLAEATIDDLARVMIGTADAPNKVYNGAANVVIALLGGPEAATRRLHARDPDFAGLVVNRYMLADRKPSGDNLATAESLAAVHSRLAARQVAGLRPETIDAAREVLRSGDESPQLFAKGGSLQTDPMTRVRAGWWEGDKRKLVVVVMGSAPRPEENSTEAYEALSTRVRTVWDAAREAFADSR